MASKIDHLLKNFRNVKNLRGPILVHVLTSKGKGYKPAEEDPIRFHGTGPFNIKTGESLSKDSLVPTYTQVFAQTLIKLARKDKTK